MHNLVEFANNKLAINEALHNQVDLNIFDAHVLGDGSILQIGKKQKYPNFAFYSNHKSYLEWLSERFVILKQRPIWSRSYLDKRTNKQYTGYWMRSLSSRFLDVQYKRWYPKGVKELPMDINVNAEFLLHFFLDDGSRASNGAFYLAMDAISASGTQLLRSKVESLVNSKVSIHRNGKGFRLYIPKRSNFLDVIGACPVKEFEYKWKCS